nr:synaptic vesicle glycoprotein 2B-like [Onthophagus taurus]
MVQMIKSFEKKPENFESAISKAGYGKFNIYLLLICGGCLMTVIMETMGMMFVIPSAECDLQLDLFLKSVLASISFLGVVLSSHLWGFLADTKGRRKVLLLSMIVGFLSSLASSIAPNAELFIILRFINGFFIGGASAVIYAYIGEFHNQRFRPKVVAWIATFVALGNIVLPFLSWLIIPLDVDLKILGVEVKPWRLLVASFGAPSLIWAIGLYCFPESPKYLMAQGNSDEAFEAIKTIYSVNTGKSKENFPVSDLILDEIPMEKDKKNGIFKTIWSQTAPLFKKPYLTKTLMVCFLQFGTFASSSGLFMWYPEILNRIEQYPFQDITCTALSYGNIEEDDSICFDSMNESVYIPSIIIGGALAVLYIISGTIINRLGAKNLLIIILGVSAGCGIASQYIKIDSWSKILMGIFLLSSAGVGIINTITVELYPTQLRGMALAISLMAGRFGAVAGSNVTGQLVYKVCEYTFYVFAADHIVLIIVTFLLPAASKLRPMIEPIT